MALAKYCTSCVAGYLFAQHIIPAGALYVKCVTRPAHTTSTIYADAIIYDTKICECGGGGK